MAEAIHAPEPDINELKMTKSAERKRDRVVVVEFCVDVDGRTVDMTVARRYRWDPSLVDVLTSTIARWRFTPFLVDGRAIKVCTSRKFEIRFR